MLKGDRDMGKGLHGGLVLLGKALSSQKEPKVPVVEPKGINLLLILFFFENYRYIDLETSIKLKKCN